MAPPNNIYEQGRLQFQTDAIMSVTSRRTGNDMAQGDITDNVIKTVRHTSFYLAAGDRKSVV